METYLKCNHCKRVVGPTGWEALSEWLERHSSLGLEPSVFGLGANLMQSKHKLLLSLKFSDPSTFLELATQPGVTQASGMCSHHIPFPRVNSSPKGELTAGLSKKPKRAGPVLL